MINVAILILAAQAPPAMEVAHLRPLAALAALAALVALAPLAQREW